MTLDYLKDSLFEMINEGDSRLKIADIDTNDQKNTLTILTTDGSRFEIECRELPDKEV